MTAKSYLISSSPFDKDGIMLQTEVFEEFLFNNAMHRFVARTLDVKKDKAVVSSLDDLLILSCLKLAWL